MHFQMDLRGHVIDSSDKSFRIFVEVGCENEIRNLHIEVLLIIDE